LKLGSGTFKQEQLMRRKSR